MPYLNCTYSSLWVTNATAFGINATTVGVINGMFALPTIVLNLLILNAFVRKKKLRKASNIILFSLSLTDVMSGIVIQPLFAISVFKAVDADIYDYPCWLIKVSGIGGYILASISLATVSFISLERYIAIFHPYIYSREMTSKTIKRTCVTIWVIPTIVVLTIFLLKGHDVFFWINGIFIAAVYLWNISIYVRISRQVYQVRRELIRLHSRFSSEKNIATQSKVTQVAGSIIVALLLCYLPQIVASLLRIILRHRFLLEYVEYWTVTLALISPCLNPLFYCYYNSEIRKEVFFVIKYFKKEATGRPGNRIPKPAIIVNEWNSNLSNNTPRYLPSETMREHNLKTSPELGRENNAFDTIDLSSNGTGSENISTSNIDVKSKAFDRVDSISKMADDDLSPSVNIDDKNKAFDTDDSNNTLVNDDLSNPANIKTVDEMIVTEISCNETCAENNSISADLAVKPKALDTDDSGEFFDKKKINGSDETNRIECDFIEDVSDIETNEISYDNKGFKSDYEDDS